MARRLLAVVSALLITLAASSVAYAGAARTASGSFTADVDFATLTLTPQGATCRLAVEGVLEFVGALEGTATGMTTARVLAPCDEVAVNPPGTFRDVFRADLDFAGTLDGAPVATAIRYQGVTMPGGAISGQMILSDGLRGALRVDAQVAQAGTYDGVVVARQ